jgi:protein-L-isoaspartate O-methyltransferase
MPLFACTIFTSAFLLFLVQPIVAKEILPWFGGSAAVWTTCLVFFQVALLAGYTYSDFTTRRLTPRVQATLHVVLLIASVAVLPIIPDASWKPAGSEDPGLRILGLLLATIGLPYFLLATTGPLVQAWFARAYPLGTVYRLFALSNLASMLALISYPFAIEPWITTAVQAGTWSIGYAVFALLCAATALYSLRKSAAPAAAVAAAAPDDGPAPSRFDLILWLSLSAMGSWMLLAITNHVTQNIASIPFLWLVPLALYLLTFILCFESDGWYQRSYLLGPCAVLLGFCAWGLQSSDVTLDIKTAVPLYLTGLFVFCMFFHGELAKMRPAPRYLTLFYLMISLGGALGGMFVGLIAPRIFPTYYELGLGFVVAAILATITLRKQPFFVWILPIALAGVCGYFWNKQVEQLHENTRVMVRDFYGTLRVKEVGTGDDVVRRLIHGVILHGEQYLKAERRNSPTTYYGPDSGVALAIKNTQQDNQRVGVIGLGTGTLAVWGKPGDHYRFFDINPQVISIAETEFTYLKDSKAQVEISLGDARLSLEREAPHDFDVLVVDAFSSDSIPVHLITKEAMAVYLKHVKHGGAVAFHVTNRFLKLAPVVKQIADDLGLHAALIVDEAQDTVFSKTDWVIVTRDKALVENEAIAQKASAIDAIPGLRLWTDDFNNLYQILK